MILAVGSCKDDGLVPQMGSRRGEAKDEGQDTGFHMLHLGPLRCAPWHPHICHPESQERMQFAIRSLPSGGGGHHTGVAWALNPGTGVHGSRQRDSCQRLV